MRQYTFPSMNLKIESSPFGLFEDSFQVLRCSFGELCVCNSFLRVPFFGRFGVVKETKRTSFLSEFRGVAGGLVRLCSARLGAEVALEQEQEQLIFEAIFWSDRLDLKLHVPRAVKGTSIKASKNGSSLVFNRDPFISSF